MLVENLIIVPVDIDDAATLTELSVRTFCDKFGPLNKQEDMDMYVASEMNLKKLTAELSDTKNRFFFVCDGQQPIGYVKLRPGTKPAELDSKQPIELERLYVLQEYQGKKAGATLMNHCIDHAINNGHDVMWLGVWEHNDGAIKFYKSFGFELFSSHPFVLGKDKQTDVMMKKSLRSS